MLNVLKAPILSVFSATIGVKAVTMAAFQFQGPIY